MDFGKDFKKYATKDRGISSISLDNFTSAYGNYISPTIIEERQLNIATMDVFSRLMMVARTPLLGALHRRSLGGHRGRVEE